MQNINNDQHITKTLKKLAQKFHEVFYPTDASNLRFFFAPGRVNLMGDHIDYCGGMVLPAAIKQGTYFAACVNSSNRARFHSAYFGETKDIPLDNIAYVQEDGWLNYPKGVLNEYRKLSLEISGMDVLCSGDLPIGSALSSSASLLVGTAIITLSLSEDREKAASLWQETEIALLCQRAESNFNGLECGTMDQATIVMGREGKALHLNCANLECEYVTPILGDCVFLIVDSGRPRALKESKYNERKAQADAILTILQKDMPGLQNLCETEDLHYALKCIQNERRNHLWDKETLKRRVRHIISENMRVRRTKEALETGDSELLGKILTESHLSLDKDYEVSGETLNLLVYESLKHPAALGARMTGAGFSGCILCLIRKSALKDYCDYITKIYKKKTDIDVSCFVVEFAAGARELRSTQKNK